MYEIKGEAAINTVLAERNGRGVERKTVSRTEKILVYITIPVLCLYLLGCNLAGFGLNEIASRAEYTVVPFSPF
jgi:hypothetical protein